MPDTCPGAGFRWKFPQIRTLRSQVCKTARLYPPAPAICRQLLEAGEVVVARSGITTTFPARFTLVLAANPCPCAKVAGPAEGCSCGPAARRRYLGRISGPLLDRVDVKIELEPVGRKELLHDRTFAESSRTVAVRVAQARDRAARRLRGTP